jgi:hypothetical protein
VARHAGRRLAVGEPFRLSWRVSAGLDGKAKAKLPSGGVPQGTFAVNVSREPSQARVDPDSGEVVRGGDAGRD